MPSRLDRIEQAIADILNGQRLIMQNIGLLKNQELLQAAKAQHQEVQNLLAKARESELKQVGSN